MEVRKLIQGMPSPNPSSSNKLPGSVGGELIISDASDNDHPDASALSTGIISTNSALTSASLEAVPNVGVAWLL